MDYSPWGREESDTTERLHVFICDLRGFPGGAEVKASAMWETMVLSMGREDPLEKEMATHSSILAWRIPWTEELGGLQSMGRKESDTTERLRFHFHFRR